MPETTPTTPARAKRPAGGGASRGANRDRTITIQQIRSGICCNAIHKKTLKALGLRRPNQKVVRPDNPAVRGMVGSIPHLVRIVEG